MTAMHYLFRSLRRLLIVALLLLPALPAQTLQLADGNVLLAKVEDANGDGLHVKRLDNGGVLDLRWSHLTPECALRIKQEWNLASTSEDELTVNVQEVHYRLNGSPTTLIGKVVDSQNGILTVQCKGNQYRVPTAELIGTGIRQVSVPVAQVYTLDEYYTERLSQDPPGDDADKHILLAEDLIKVRDYDHAEEHLVKAKELGNSKDPKGLEMWTARLARYKESKKERDLLDQIQVARARGTFDKGLQLIAQYEQEYPAGKGKLRAEFDTEQKKFQQTRARFLSLQIAELWRNSIRTVAEKKLMERGLTLAAVREYAESKMKDDITARIAAQLKLDPEEVKTLWQQRANYPNGKRTELFSYNIGSWVLGEKDILEDTKQGQANDAQQQKDPAQDREIERVAKLIREAMQRSRAAAKGQGGAPKEPTEEDWWADADHSQRTSWLRAYYAEHGGDLVVTIAYANPCISCYGAGTVPELGPQGKVQQTKCYLCHATKYTRAFRAY